MFQRETHFISSRIRRIIRELSICSGKILCKLILANYEALYLCSLGQQQREIELLRRKELFYRVF